MHKLITFVHVFTNSIINPQYYDKLTKVKAWFSWQYFLFLNFLLSFVVLLHVIPAVVSFQVAPVADQLVATFPEGVVISGDATGLHINQDLPYSIPFPEFMKDAAQQEIPDQAYLNVNDIPYDQAVDFNLITFASDESIQSIQDFYDSQSLILVTDTTIYALDDAETGEVRVYGMPAFDEAFSVSRDDLKNIANTIIAHPFFAQKWYVPLLGLGSVLLILPLSIWLRTMAVAFYSLFVWVIVAFFMKSKKLSYSTLFQLGLHSLTLPLLIKIIVDYFVWFDFSGFWFMVAYLVWTLFLVSTISTNSTNQGKQVKDHAPHTLTKQVVTKHKTTKAKVSKK